jgi:hypothetical protein
MTGIKILGAAAILASALASTAMAQEVIYNPGYCAQFYPNANCQNKGPGNPYTDGYQRQTYQDRAYRDRAYRDNRYWHDSYNFVCTPGKRFRSEDGRMHLCR